MCSFNPSFGTWLHWQWWPIPPSFNILKATAFPFFSLSFKTSSGLHFKCSIQYQWPLSSLLCHGLQNAALVYKLLLFPCYLFHLNGLPFLRTLTVWGIGNGRSVLNHGDGIFLVLSSSTFWYETSEPLLWLCLDVLVRSGENEATMPTCHLHHFACSALKYDL